MQPLGTIHGTTSTHKFKFKVESSVKKWDYILANHPEVGPVLSQVLEIEAGQEALKNAAKTSSSAAVRAARVKFFSEATQAAAIGGASYVSLYAASTALAMSPAGTYMEELEAYTADVERQLAAVLTAFQMTKEGAGLRGEQLREAYPDIHFHAFSPEEINYYALHRLLDTKIYDLVLICETWNTRELKLLNQNYQIE